MQDFPEFMKNPKNRIPDKDQHTQGVEGYYFEGATILRWHTGFATPTEHQILTLMNLMST